MMDSARLAAASPMHGLYGITPEWDDTDRLIAAVTAGVRGGLRVLQFRRKNLTPAQKQAQALALCDACTRLGIPLIINDDWRLALDVGAAGVHLGREDGNIAEVRRQVGNDLLIGASCYNEFALAEAALAAGADHIAFGAVFSSPTKPAAVNAPLSLLTRARKLRVPQDDALPPIRPALVAIGGITPANAASVVAAGADALAVISALFEADDIEATARAFSQAFVAA